MKASAKLVVGALMGACILGVVGVALAGEHGYGALAYSYSKNEYGWAVDQPSKEVAEKVAVDACNHKTHDTSCKLREVFHEHLCGAFVQDAAGKVGMFGAADTAQDAENIAMKDCKGKSAAPTTCSVKVSACMRH